MKLLLCTAIYFTIGFIFAVLMFRENIRIYGHKPHSFFDLSGYEQIFVSFIFVLWPLALVLLVAAVVLNLIIAIASIEKKEDDDGETDEKRGS